MKVFLKLVYTRVRGLCFKRRVDEELNAEMEFHLRMRVDENLRAGMELDQAESAARKRYGNAGRIRDESLDVKGGGFIESMLQDVRYSVRLLLRNPGFTSVSVLTLALGIGANTAVFSVVNAALLKPLPYPQPERMVFVFESSIADPKAEDSLSPQNFTDIRQRSNTFDSYCALNSTSFILTGEDQPEALNGMMASADFGKVVGVIPEVGRYFTPDEDTPGKNQVVLISDGLWRRRYGADRAVVGRNIQLNGLPFTVIGVMPPNFNFPWSNIEVWAPLGLDLSDSSRGSFLETAARLKSGVTVEQARADVRSIAAQFRKEIPNMGEDFSLGVKSVRDEVVGKVERPLMILFGAVVLVLLIACANITSLMLGRATSRWKEVAVRSALGASRWRVVRLLLTESVLLSLTGGGLGLVLAIYGVDLLIKINPAVLPRGDKVTINSAVIAFTFLISLVTAMIFGLAPAWQAAKIDLNQTLRESSRASTGVRGLKLVRSGLVVVEISFSLVLLMGAGLLLQSFWKLLQVDPGFRPDNLLTCSVDLPAAKYPDDWQRAQFFRRILEQVRMLPEVQSAGFGSSLPFSGSRGHSSFTIDDQPMSRDDANAPSADRHQVAPGYFAAMGIPIREGRDFAENDDIQHPGVVVINDAAARRFWPSENPVGKRITIGMGQEVKLYGKPVSREIVGIVGNVKHEELTADFQPEMYIPSYQLPPRGMSLVVRGIVPLDVLSQSIRRAVQSVDRDEPIRRVQTLDVAVRASVASRRFLATLLLVFAFAALVLAVIGIYGVVSYSVAQRTHEIGIRMALGAERHDVLMLVLRQGMILLVAGVCVGLAAALALTRVLSSFLYGVRANDFKTFAGLSLLLALVALLACLVPARRATNVDPLIALRYE